MEGGERKERCNDVFDPGIYYDRRTGMWKRLNGDRYMNGFACIMLAENRSQ